MSKEEYQKYIEQGVATRRNTYRGKELKLTEDFWTSIKNGTFDDIYVGDYIKSKTNNNVTWLIADIDNYLHTGDTGHELTSHHLTIIPASPLMNASMNTTATTNGGYYGSEMVSGCNGQYNDYESMQSGNCTGSILDEVYNTYIKSDFEDEHVLTYSNILSVKVDNDLYTQTTEKGKSSAWKWVNDRKLDLMSEVNVLGISTTSSSVFDIGIDNRQYAIFQLKPEFLNSYNSSSFSYWLKGVADSTTFVAIYVPGYSFGANPTVLSGVRPRFLIG